ncbi:hypothetical protein [Flavilitoribacter nigricans]|uniref:Uncharacterized protein n=1 Tax=Flavilitoribacter nigricans (strain ATCC 23147 / DSM 23189 / NBRC 102662 / NCIMB 1420 / SS-2) TaxID=1122177 RepID=A0A2D0N1V3_FLAN2|nr:hypothetical protein [Flavilitoribacter nigricans]PHN02522.1 hypothetical protein CRP01_31595 [Flavilitoribacter nigricans DSM 23189 = NBRC 102662]
MIQPNSVKIIDCFSLPPLGLLAEIQHQQNGLPPGTKLTDPETGETWIVKKRIFSGILLAEDAEIYFPCETASDHLSARFKSEEERERAFQQERQKRQNGIYPYALGLVNKKLQRLLPGNGCILHIEPENPV